MEFKETPAGLRLKDVELVWAQNSREFFFANSMVIHGTTPIVVDPSANFTYFEQLALSPKATRVVNTHYHSDHQALNHLFHNATFLCHAADAPALRSWTELQKRIDQNQDSPYSQWARNMWQQMHMLETPVTIELQEGDILESEQHRLQVIHIPGHTPGHIALLVEDIGLLFTADIDLTPFGPWYANEVSNIDQFEASIAKVKRIEANYYTTSHGQRILDRPTFLEKLDRFSGHIARRDEEILTALKLKPQTSEELCEYGIIYRKSQLKVDALKTYFARKMIEKHCERLERRGLLIRAGDRYALAAA